MLGYKDKGKQIEAFVYDLRNDRVSRRVPVTGKMAADWISMSQTGRYVVLMGGDRSRVYDVEMNHLRDLPLGSFGHADLCLTADGRDVMVYDSTDRRSNPPQRQHDRSGERGRHRAAPHRLEEHAPRILPEPGPPGLRR